MESEKIHVLILEDSEEDCNLILRELGKAGFETTWRRVETREDFHAHLDSSLDVILADYHLPAFDALHALRLMHQSGLDIPFIVVTGVLGDEAAAECVVRGAADYLLKDRLGRLGSAIRRALSDQRLRREKRQMESVLQSRNRSLRVLNQSNQALIRGSDEPTLLHTVCRNIVETGGYRMAWVGYREDDNQKTVRPVAHAGFEQGYLAAIHVSYAAGEYGRGTAGTAIRAELPSIVQNIAAEPRFGPWREEALKRSYASVLSLPLRRGHESPFGALTIFASEVNAFSDEEVKLLTELADDLGFGISTIRVEAERRESEKAVQRLVKAIEQTIETVIITDAKGIIEYVNPTFERVTGYTREEAIGKSLRILKSGKHDEAFYRRLWETILRGDVFQGKMINKRKDGSLYEEESTISPVRDVSGSIMGFVAIKRDLVDDVEPG